MLTKIDMKKLNTLMDQNPENRELLEKVLASHQFTVSQISHEIRNPLTLVYSSLQLIQSQHPEVKDFRHWNSVMTDIEFITDLLKELSTFNNGERIALSTFESVLFMKRLALSFAAFLTDSSVEFTSKIDPDLPEIVADKVKLKEVLLNLLHNAYDAVKPEGSIRMEVLYEAPNIVIRIEDNGCGIASDDLDTIFQPFVTYKSNGTGLGLAIAQRIIDAHHGTIQLTSELHKGTTFEITLPVEQNCYQETGT